MTYQFPNFNGATVEAWEWISNVIPYFTGYDYWVWLFFNAGIKVSQC